MKLKTSIIATSAAVLALVAAYGCVGPPKPTSGAAPNPPPPAPAAGGFLETFDSPAGFTSRFVTQVVHGVVPPDVSSLAGRPRRSLRRAHDEPHHPRREPGRVVLLVRPVRAGLGRTS